jgi:predicted AlkP superfamily phosphohydrolase/phosphomutase
VEGRLPAFASLIQRGVSAPLQTVSNASPIIWTSVATGVRPRKHGIRGFTVAGRNVNATMRRRPAFWNVLTHYGRSVGVLGWWVSYPAEQVEGYLVSPYMVFFGPRKPERVQVTWEAGDPRRAYPPELLAELGESVYVAADAKPEELGAIYGGADRSSQTPWVWARDRSYYEMALQLMETRPVETVAVYLQGIDVVSHDLSYFAYGRNVNRARKPRVSPEEFEAGLARVEAMYERIDELLAGLLAQTPADADVIVVSDHGWEYDGTNHLNRNPGVFLASGPSFRESGRFEDVSVLDVTPTLLALLGVPLSRDFDGLPSEAALRPGLAAAARWVDAYPLPSVGLTSGVDGTSPDDEQLMDRLRALGYVE